MVVVVVAVVVAVVVGVVVVVVVFVVVVVVVVVLVVVVVVVVLAVWCMCVCISTFLNSIAFLREHVHGTIFILQDLEIQHMHCICKLHRVLRRLRVRNCLAMPFGIWCVLSYLDS